MPHICNSFPPWFVSCPPSLPPLPHTYGRGEPCAHLTPLPPACRSGRTLRSSHSSPPPTEADTHRAHLALLEGGTERAHVAAQEVEASAATAAAAGGRGWGRRWGHRRRRRRRSRSSIASAPAGTAAAAGAGTAADYPSAAAAAAPAPRGRCMCVCVFVFGMFRSPFLADMQTITCDRPVTCQCLHPRSGGGPSAPPEWRGNTRDLRGPSHPPCHTMHLYNLNG